ncbi:MAG TPA: hypothetical protein VMT37_02430 [Solirubrobacterales bacterium]|nr:hypothetical protein [Solirubrobacterales bacterium]
MRSNDLKARVAASNPVDRERPASQPLSAAEEELLDALLAEPLPAPPAATRQPSRLRGGRPMRLALGGAAALAAAGAVLFVSAGGDNTPAAFAVEREDGGGVRIQIYNLGDPEGVEQALEEAGVRSQVTFLPAGMTCREPHYQPSMALLRTLEPNQSQPQPWAGFDYESIDGPLTIAVGDYQQRQEMDEEIRDAVRQGDYAAADWPSFVIDPSGLRPDQTLVMSSSPTPAGYRQPAPSGASSGRVEIHSTESAQIDTVGQVRVAEGEVGPCEPVAAAAGQAPVRAPEGGWDFSAHEYAGWGFGLGPKSGE